ncbi:MAG: hypothetical protein P9L93_02000 [Candidatus Gorgyraea atricola]|nr:hypothetical protein [Candidatus Gorgyraea atricola]
MKPLARRNVVLSVIILTSVTLFGCVSSRQQLLATNESQVQLRSMQTRAFDTTDKQKMLRTIISTLQDLDFVIDRADLTIGSVTGSKFTANTLLKLSVTARPRGETQLLVRANAQYGLKAIEDPEPYQDFFNALEKAIFLTAHQVD